MRSKGLSQCYEDLRGFDSGGRVQVVAQVNADRADGSRVTQSYADAIRVMAVETYGRKYVSTVIEANYAEVLFDDIQRNSKFRIDDEQFVPANRDSDERTG